MRVNKRLYVAGNKSGDSSNLDVRDLAVRCLVVQRPDTDAQRPGCLSFVPKPHVLCRAAKLCMNISHTACAGVNRTALWRTPKLFKNTTNSGLHFAEYHISSSREAARGDFKGVLKQRKVRGGNLNGQRQDIFGAFWRNGEPRPSVMFICELPIVRKQNRWRIPHFERDLRRILSCR